MSQYNRIVHTGNKAVNDCTNEFLVVCAARVLELQDKGFREVGRTFGLLNRDFEPQRDWIPNIPIVPIGRFATLDVKQKSRVKGQLSRIGTREGFDKEAVDLEDMARGITSAVPIAGDLYLIDYVHSLWDTKQIRNKELFLVNQEAGKPIFRFFAQKGFQLYKNGKFTFIEPKISKVPYLVKHYPLKVNEIRKVGEMQVAPIFLREVDTCPRRGYIGLGPCKPRLSRYKDFEEHVESKKEK